VAFVSTLAVSCFDASTFTEVCKARIIPVNQRQQEQKQEQRLRAPRVTFRPPALGSIIEKLPRELLSPTSDEAGGGSGRDDRCQAQQPYESTCHKLVWNADLVCYQTIEGGSGEGERRRGGAIAVARALNAVGASEKGGDKTRSMTASTEAAIALHENGEAHEEEQKTFGAVWFRVDERTVPPWLAVTPMEGFFAQPPKPPAPSSLFSLSAPSSKIQEATISVETLPLSDELFRRHEIGNFLRAVVVVEVFLSPAATQDPGPSGSGVMGSAQQTEQLQLPDALLPVSVEYKEPVKLVIEAGSINGSLGLSSGSGIGFSGVGGGGEEAIRMSTSLPGPLRGSNQHHQHPHQSQQHTYSSRGGTPTRQQPSALYFPHASSKLGAARKHLTTPLSSSRQSTASRQSEMNDSNIETSEAVIF
jgi:hypothetical protein